MNRDTTVTTNPITAETRPKETEEHKGLGLLDKIKEVFKGRDQHEETTTDTITSGPAQTNKTLPAGANINIPSKSTLVEKVVEPTQVEAKESTVHHRPEVVHVPHVERHDVERVVVHEVPHEIHHKVHHEQPEKIVHDVRHDVVEHRKDVYVHKYKEDEQHDVNRNVAEQVNVAVEKQEGRPLPSETVVEKEKAVPKSVLAANQEKVTVEKPAVVGKLEAERAAAEAMKPKTTSSRRA
eukprot:GEZU01039102.1.p1 GENE.GEZU01039102.1~~GEZU01039102.1.p1  ORF type:complete len:264 (-),score=80.04 GEZU01039102.1:6-719(-)